jgi:AcrR family transcriptional regulator
LEKILEAARHEFSEFGLEGSRVDGIAKRAGVNKAMIYYHFKSKDELYFEVIRTFFGHVASGVKEAVDPSASLERVLAGIAEVYARHMQEVVSVRPIMLRELANPHQEIIDEISDMLVASGLPTVIREKLLEEQAEGTVRDLDPWQATLSFVLMNMGYLLVAPLADRVLNITNRARFIDERKSANVDLFLYGVKVRPE